MKQLTVAFRNFPKVPKNNVTLKNHGFILKTSAIFAKVPKNSVTLKNFGFILKTSASGFALTLWRRNYFFNFSTFCI